MTSTVDIGIIIPLKEEFSELHKQLPSPQKSEDKETGATDYSFEWGSYQCVTTFVGEMGLEKAALATDRFIKRCQPTTIVLLGIAGGIDEDVKLGDVVVAKSVNNYLAKAKAVPGDNNSFTFDAGGDPYRCSDDIVRRIQNLDFAHSEIYHQWQENCTERQRKTIAGEQLAELLQKDYLRETVKFTEGPIASGPVVGAAKEFISWLKKNNRNYLALEMEGGGMLGAVYSKDNPEKTLILRGISDFGDERKQELDQIGKGGIRRYAMNNAIALLWKLLEAEVLPKESVQFQGKFQQLTLAKRNQLEDEITNLFNEDELIRVLRRMELDLNNISARSNPYINRVSDLVEWLNRQGKVEEFISEAAKVNSNLNFNT
ncbi:MAG: 5'-methylthioadenosine/S-adenosylhomocysteine nucleosidase [Symploca sp. SIO2E9]|nr:5'-methylthioadenosine/S-adenosylhomocysteine nucleosidase [Symploca sp. SIO2E9]